MSQMVRNFPPATMSEMYIPVIKQQLQQQLGPEKFLMYVRLLRDWFGQRLAKNLFDYEISTLLEGRCLDLHNLLVRSILQSAIGNTAGLYNSNIQPTYSSAQSVIPTVNFSGDSSVYAHSVPDVQYPSSVPTSMPSPNPYTYTAPPMPISITEEPCIQFSESLMQEEFELELPIEQVKPVMQCVTGLEIMDQGPPPECDWLLEAKVTFPATEENISDPTPNFKNRFPPWFAHDFQRVNTKSYTHDINMVPNVTHMFSIMKDILERKPHLKQHFVIPNDKKAPYLTSGCSLYGRILIKAWDRNIQNVNLLVTEYAVNAVKEHIKGIVIKILQQRRPFRMRDDRIMHSMGVPYPNPYLRQGFHMYDEAYGSDTTKMADVVMQVPAPFPTLEEKERLAALQVAASYPSRESRFISAKGTMMDFLYALNQNPAMIPNCRSRFKLLDAILRQNKGFAGSHNAQYPCPDEEEDDILNPSPLLPVVSY